LRKERRNGDLAKAAEGLKVSARTLQRWRDRPRPPRRGRPPHSKRTLAQAKGQLRRLIEQLGWGIGRQVAQARLPKVPRRVICMTLKALKSEHRTRQRARRAKQRVTLRVLTRDTLLGQDSTHVGSCRSKRVWAELQKDLGTLKARARGNGRSLTGKAMLGQLHRLKATGRLPLVVVTDNASPYCCEEVGAWLKANQVVHLLSRPRTPTDNGAVERAIGEGKGLSGLGAGVGFRRAADGPPLLDKALVLINRHRPRPSRGGLTAEELCRVLPHWRSMVSMSKFYAAVARAVRIRTRGKKGRDRRREARDAVFAVLCRFKLARRLKGGVPWNARRRRRGPSRPTAAMGPPNAYAVTREVAEIGSPEEARLFFGEGVLERQVYASLFPRERR
jgi:transposase InsO family protein